MIKSLIRGAVRRVALRILEWPELAASAKKLVRLSPALDQRLRRILGRTPAHALPASTPELQTPSQRPRPVPPEVARVLVDLRHAMADRESGSGAP